MRQETTVQQKLKQVIYRHLQRILRDNFKRRPSSCRFNRTYGDNNVGVCVFRLDGEPRGAHCDIRFGGEPSAKDCPWFEPRQSRDEIKVEFRALLNQSSRGVIAAAFPEVMALLWVLDSENDASDWEEVVDNALALSSEDDEEEGGR